MGGRHEILPMAERGLVVVTILAACGALCSALFTNFFALGMFLGVAGLTLGMLSITSAIIKK